MYVTKYTKNLAGYISSSYSESHSKSPARDSSIKFGFRASLCWYVILSFISCLCFVCVFAKVYNGLQMRYTGGVFFWQKLWTVVELIVIIAVLCDRRCATSLCCDAVMAERGDCSKVRALEKEGEVKTRNFQKKVTEIYFYSNLLQGQ